MKLLGLAIRMLQPELEKNNMKIAFKVDGQGQMSPTFNNFERSYQVTSILDP